MFNSLVAVWILLCALLNFAGWGLSALHALNETGYVVVLLLIVAGGWIWRRELGLGGGGRGRLNPRKFCRRFRRLFPASFLGLAGLAILGGLLHPPANYDALAYRIPRVLHWLTADQWFWMQTDFPRLNTRICGFEWVSAPLILFFKTDRLLFVINAISFLLLPGLIFSVLRQLGVRAGVAWHWMWLFPGGYGFLLQAGSVSNDMFGAVFALAAIDFALRARRTKELPAALLSILSAALLTSSKSSNLPLLLPWVIALYPSGRRLCGKPLATGAVILLAAGASFLPTAVLNLKYCGNWTGLNIESANFLSNRPFFHLSVNSVLLTIQNLAPPVFPVAAKWNALMDATIPTELAKVLQARFERQGARLALGEMQREESAGLGCGLTLLLLATAGWRLCHRDKKFGPGRRLWGVATLIVIGTWMAAVVFMAKSGLSPAARYLLPYYVIMASPILMGTAVARLVRMRWWRITALVGVAMAALVIVVTPPRPLWPAVTLLREAGAEHSPNPLVRRAWTVYSVYGERADAFAPARASLPREADPLGLVTFDDPETSLWRPFGARRIVHVTKTDTAASLDARGIQYVLVSSTVLAVQYQTTLADWLKQVEGEVVQTLALTLRAESGPKDWYVVKIRRAPKRQIN